MKDEEDNEILEVLNPGELRIGNLVYGGVTYSFCRVTRIEKDEDGNNIDAIAISEDSKNDFRMLFGIPLSATRLIKMGFIQDNDNECLFRHNWFALEIKLIGESNFWHFTGIYTDPTSVKKKIENGITIYSSVFLSVNEELKYVHEFQNLYFDMTHTELFPQGIIS